MCLQGCGPRVAQASLWRDERAVSAVFNCAGGISFSLREPYDYALNRELAIQREVRKQRGCPFAGVAQVTTNPNDAFPGNVHQSAAIEAMAGQFSSEAAVKGASVGPATEICAICGSDGYAEGRHQPANGDRDQGGSGGDGDSDGSVSCSGRDSCHRRLARNYSRLDPVDWMAIRSAERRWGRGGRPLGRATCRRTARR